MQESGTMPTLISYEEAEQIILELNELLLDQMTLTTDVKNVNEMRRLLMEDTQDCSLRRIYTYATTGKWIGGDHTEIPLFLDACEMELPQYFRAAYAYSYNKFEKLETLYELLHARSVIDSEVCGPGDAFWEKLPPIEEGVLTRRQVALLEGKKEDTIRNAAYAKGDACLKPFSENLYRAEDVKRWQQARGTFKPSVFSHGDPYSFEINSAHDLKVWLEIFCDPQHVPTITLDQIREAVGIEYQDAFDTFWECPRLTNPNLSWFTAESATKLCLLTGAEPRWLAKKVHQIYQSLIPEMIEKLPRDKDFEMQKKEHEAKEATTDTLVNGDLIRQTLKNCNGITAHALQRGKANAKMDGYTNGKLTFTHEHNLKTQYLWLPREVGEELELPKKLYEKANLNINGDYGRHSGLKKYPDIAYADLYKIEIKTLGDLQVVMDQLKP